MLFFNSFSLQNVDLNLGCTEDNQKFGDWSSSCSSVGLMGIRWIELNSYLTGMKLLLK